jgi:valyl-tRNA synthetase
VSLAGLVDAGKERARLSKEIESTEKYVNSVKAKLAGDFSKNAPEKVVAAEKGKLEEAEKKLETLKSQIASLPQA